jgi:hypothetical protein
VDIQAAMAPSGEDGDGEGDGDSGGEGAGETGDAEDETPGD